MVVRETAVHGQASLNKIAARLRGAACLSQLSWRALQALDCSSDFLSKHQNQIAVARSRLQKRPLGILFPRQGGKRSFVLSLRIRRLRRVELDGRRGVGFSRV